MSALFSGNATYYRHDIAVKEKLKTVWVNPVSCQQHKITINYRRNDDIPTAIENQLLQSPEYQDWETKRVVLIQMVSTELGRLECALWPTVTGLEFRTHEDGTVRWTQFEDIDEIVRRMKITDIPPHFPRIDASDVSHVGDLVATVSVVSYRGDLFALKAHDYPSQNDEFPMEVNTLVQLSNVPHVAQLLGVVVDDSLSDLQPCVKGILLPFCEKGDLKTLLRNAMPPAEASRKDRWAAQVAHAIMTIHKMGLMHGDLKCGNVVVDKFDDAFLIDITNGDGFTEGWTPIEDNRMDPRTDIYSFGVTLWEMIHNGADPIGEPIPMSVDGDASETLKCLVRECVLKEAAERPSSAQLHTVLINCGCTKN